MTVESSKQGAKRNKKQEMAAEAIAIALSLQNNMTVRISEPPMGSQGAPRTIETTNDVNSRTKGKGKATEEACDMSEMPNSQNSKPKSKVTRKVKANGPKKVKFNEFGQSVGKKAAPFASFLSDAAEGFVPLTVPTWRRLTNEFRDVIWNHVKKHYIVEDCHRKRCFQKMAELWRQQKSLKIKDIEKKVQSASVEAVARDTQPKNVHSLDDWIKFVKHVLSPADKKRRGFYKGIRQLKVLNYRKSKKGFARLMYEMKKKSDNPEAITRPVVWVEGYTRKKKDGEEDVEDPEIVRQVKEKMAEQPDSSQWTINDDPVSQVLGPERRGRVRGYGFGATPSQICGRGYVDRQAFMMMEKKYQGLEMKLNELYSRFNIVDSSSENSNVPIPPMDANVPPLKRKKEASPEASPVSASSKQVKISKGEMQGRVCEDVNKQAPQMQHVLLLRWYGTDEKIVAIGDLASKDPEDKVHCVPLGAGVWKVWVREVIEDIEVYRPTEEFTTLSEAKGSTVAWPSKSIKLL